MRQEWCLAYRTDVLNRGHNTNNYAEATFHVIKDIILTRLKAFNPLALLVYVVGVLEKYYCGRLVSAAFVLLTKPYLLYEKVRDRAAEIVSVSADAVVGLGNDMYRVLSAKDPSQHYEVQSTTGVCTCYYGQQGEFCKHQAAVRLKFGLLYPNCPALTTGDKQQLYYIAAGSCTVHSSFFAHFASQWATARSISGGGESATPPVGVSGAENMDVDTAGDECSNNTVDGGQIRQKLGREVDRLCQLLSDSESDNSMTTAADKLARQLEVIKTAQQLYM